MLSAAFVLVISAGAIAAGAGYVRKANAMRHFVNVKGRVLSREVTTVPSGDTREGVYGDGGGYMPKVTYRFTANGQEFTGDKYAYASRGLRRSLAESTVAAIPDDVEVWFDPQNPRDAYLHKHAPTIGWVLVAGGAFAALASIGWMLA